MIALYSIELGDGGPGTMDPQIETQKTRPDPLVSFRCEHKIFSANLKRGPRCHESICMEVANNVFDRNSGGQNVAKYKGIRYSLKFAENA